MMKLRGIYFFNTVGVAFGGVTPKMFFVIKKILGVDRMTGPPVLQIAYTNAKKDFYGC